MCCDFILIFEEINVFVKVRSLKVLKLFVYILEFIIRVLEIIVCIFFLYLDYLRNVCDRKGIIVLEFLRIIIIVSFSNLVIIYIKYECYICVLYIVCI